MSKPAAPAEMAPPPKKMGRAALVVGLANLIGRLSGLAREVAFAAAFGASPVADAFNAAFRVPNLLREVFVEGAMANVYVPLFARTHEREGPEAGWALSNALLGVLSLVLGGITLLYLVAAEPFVILVAAGFRSVPGKVELSAQLVRIMAPFLAFLSVGSLWSGMLNVRGRFFLPALTPSLLGLFSVAACLAGPAFERVTGVPAIHVVAGATTLSGLASMALLYPSLRALGYRIRPTLAGHPELRRAMGFLGAAFIGAMVVQLNLLVESQLASRWGDGPVSQLQYGFRLVQIPQNLIAGSVAVATLATLSLQLARRELDASRDTVGRAVLMTLGLVTPAAVGLYLLAGPLIALIYERGAFLAADTAATASVLRGYAIASVGISLYRVLLPAFFALGDPYLPMRLSLGVLIVKVPIALLLCDTLGLGLIGLPLSHALTASAEVLVLVLVLRSRLGGWSEGFVGQLARIGLASALLAVLVAALRPWADGPWLLPICALGAVVYGLLGLLFGVRELRGIARRLLPPPPPGRGPRSHPPDRPPERP